MLKLFIFLLSKKYIKITKNQRRRSNNSDDATGGLLGLPAGHAANDGTGLFRRDSGAHRLRGADIPHPRPPEGLCHLRERQAGHADFHHKCAIMRIFRLLKPFYKLSS